jgi:hypothetical protein
VILNAWAPPDLKGLALVVEGVPAVHTVLGFHGETEQGVDSKPNEVLFEELSGLRL